MIIRAHKVRLKPTPEQETRLCKAAGTARYIYNWTLSRQKENYENGGTFLQDGILRKELTNLKKTELPWLCDVSNNVAKQAVKDACGAYKRFFSGLSASPKYKSKKQSKPSFYNDPVKLRVKCNNKTVLLEKIGWVSTSEQLPHDVKYYNPRITFDGKYWYLSVGVEREPPPNVALTDVSLGIDLGVKDLAICSDGTIYRNINKTATVRRLEKKLKRLQRAVSRKYEQNKTKKGEFAKTKNIIKLEHRITLTHRRLKNIRRNHTHQATAGIVKTKPCRIVIEDLNVTGMMKNKHLARAVQQQGFYEFARQIEYKAEYYGIAVVRANRFYPSSKTCSCCGNIKTDLKLSDRTYVCVSCGYVGDRDLNAAINLSQYNIN